MKIFELNSYHNTNTMFESKSQTKIIATKNITKHKQKMISYKP